MAPNDPVPHPSPARRSSLDDTLLQRPAARTEVDPTLLGVVFPRDDHGGRSTTNAAKRILAEAIEPASPDLALAIVTEPDWRHRYPHHIQRLVELSVAQPRAAVEIAGRGLNRIYRDFSFCRDGEALALDVAMRSTPPEHLQTVTIAGQGDAPPRLEVPYRGEVLSGDALRRQAQQWVERGVAEPSFAAALEEVIAHPEWLDLSDWTIAVLGAGAEIGPVPTLAGWRANLALVDMPNPEMWRKIIDSARRGNGRTRIPVREGSSADDPRLPELAGADLLTAAPQIRNWLSALSEPLVIGCFAYLDGEAHVRLSVAMDAIVADLLALRRSVVPAYLLTPTDCYAVPLYDAMRARIGWSARGAKRLWQTPLAWMSGGRLFRPNLLRTIDGPDGFRAAVADALVVEQGPNYALAKRIQQWRALVARAAGTRVSVNVAPATRTHSVMKNRALAAAYNGARYFGVEVFDPATANALVAALLVHDLRTKSGSAAPEAALAHPLQLFVDGALHSGLWTVPYEPRSALPVAAALGFF